MASNLTKARLPAPLSLNQLRRYAVARSLFKPTTLPRAIEKLGFVQADPIRAPARAQDLTLRHRVNTYQAGDLERLYPRLGIEEDFFVNYGFLPSATQALMHPRTARSEWTSSRKKQAEAVLAFVRERGEAHPREVDSHFAHGKIKNWFGGSSNATTHLLDDMHYRGLLRIARRDGGVRVYAARQQPIGAVDGDAALDALIDVIVQKYAPLPARSLNELVNHLRSGVPQWNHLRGAALERARQRLGQAQVDGVQWFWPAQEDPKAARWTIADHVRLLAPFDPVVWDRRRFEMFWGWAYRFEAYTPAAKRVRGYYALPLLWRDHVIGWGNISVRGSQLQVDLGYVDGNAPQSAAFNAALDDELNRMAAFLGVHAFA